MSESSQRYLLNINENDVLCGRGSGPNDRVGNILFRDLILPRKAEYLAASTRESKGRIAADIVACVHYSGGRFVKKLSSAQAKEAGYKRGTVVYELANETAVLEKTKQTLRQNRAEFIEACGGEAAAVVADNDMALSQEREKRREIEPVELEGGNHRLLDRGEMYALVGEVRDQLAQQRQPQIPVSSDSTSPRPGQGMHEVTHNGDALNPIEIDAPMVSAQSIRFSSSMTKKLNASLFVSTSTGQSTTTSGVTTRNQNYLSDASMQTPSLRSDAVSERPLSPFRGGNSYGPFGVIANTVETIAVTHGEPSRSNAKDSASSVKSKEVFRSLVLKLNEEDRNQMDRQYEQHVLEKQQIEGELLHCQSQQQQEVTPSPSLMSTECEPRGENLHRGLCDSLVKSSSEDSLDLIDLIDDTAGKSNKNYAEKVSAQAPGGIITGTDSHTVPQAVQPVTADIALSRLVSVNHSDVIPVFDTSRDSTRINATNADRLAPGLNSSSKVPSVMEVRSAVPTNVHPITEKTGRRTYMFERTVAPMNTSNFSLMSMSMSLSELSQDIQDIRPFSSPATNRAGGLAGERGEHQLPRDHEVQRKDQIYMTENDDVLAPRPVEIMMQKPEALRFGESSMSLVNALEDEGFMNTSYSTIAPRIPEEPWRSGDSTE